MNFLILLFFILTDRNNVCTHSKELNKNSFVVDYAKKIIETEKKNEYKDAFDGILIEKIFIDEKVLDIDSLCSWKNYHLITITDLVHSTHSVLELFVLYDCKTNDFILIKRMIWCEPKTLVIKDKVLQDQIIWEKGPDPKSE